MGILTIPSGLSFPMSISHYDWQSGTRGITPNDYMFSDLTWLQAQGVPMSAGDLVLGKSGFLQTVVPTPGSLIVLGLGGAILAWRRRRS